MRFFVSVIMAIFTLASSTAMGADGPRIEFDKLRHDYGKILYGDKVSAEFTFVNSGDEPLIIKSLHATCGCTKAVEGSREIPPKGKSRITASFETEGLKAGRKEKSIMICTNDPVHPAIKLTLLADVVRELSIDPPTLGKKIGSHEVAVTFPVRISNSSDKTYNVTNIKTQPGELSATMKPATVRVGPHEDVSFDITVELEPQPNRAFYAGKLDIITDHPKEFDTEVKYLIQIDSGK